jgi:hypothetical protein
MVDSLTERPRDRETERPPEILATLGEGGHGAFFEVRFEKTPGALVHLRLGPGRFFGARERPSSAILA